jgi:serine phosphatase RsbU (regulator of sigma subunit)
MQIVVLDLEKGTMAAASAGHPAPLFEEAGRWREMDVEAQLVLGIDSSVHYPTQQFTLGPRVSLLLYTDGVVDVQSERGDRYTMNQLMSAIAGRPNSAQDLLDAAVNAVNHFRGNKELEDDLTLVAIQLDATAARKPREKQTAESDKGVPALAGARN